MSHLVPCPDCRRHVRTHEAICPFCGIGLDLTNVPPPALPRVRLGRAALFAFGTTLAASIGTVACSSDGDDGKGTGGASSGGASSGGASSGGASNGGTGGADVDGGLGGFAGNMALYGDPGVGGTGGIDTDAGNGALYGGPP